MIAIGVAKPNASGHAITMTVIASVVAKTTDSSPTAYHIINVASAVVIAAITSH
jgi:hypothetical protein